MERASSALVVTSMPSLIPSVVRIHCWDLLSHQNIQTTKVQTFTSLPSQCLSTLLIPLQLPTNLPPHIPCISITHSQHFHHTPPHLPQISLDPHHQSHEYVIIYLTIFTEKILLLPNFGPGARRLGRRCKPCPIPQPAYTYMYNTALNSALGTI